MVTRWSRSTSNISTLIGQNLTGEFMRKIYAASWKLFTLTAKADRVLSQLVMFLTVFFHWMYKMKYSCIICSPFSIQRETWSWSSLDYQWLPTPKVQIRGGRNEFTLDTNIFEEYVHTSITTYCHWHVLYQVWAMLSYCSREGKLYFFLCNQLYWSSEVEPFEIFGIFAFNGGYGHRGHSVWDTHLESNSPSSLVSLQPISITSGCLEINEQNIYWVMNSHHWLHMIYQVYSWCYIRIVNWTLK